MIERTFINPAASKQWQIEIDGHTIRTCLNGGKVMEALAPWRMSCGNSPSGTSGGINGRVWP